MKNVFVAGGTGLVGSSVLRTSPPGVRILSPSKSELNLMETKSVSKYFSKFSIDSVVLSAARVGGIQANSQNKLQFMQENIRIQDSVLSAAAQSGIENFAFLGSSCVYPKYSKQPITESELLTGQLEITNEAYALAKIVGLKAVMYLFEDTGFNYFSLMPSNLYGPNDNFDLNSSHVPAALMRKIHEAKTNKKVSFPIWGTGKVLREFMYVDDLSHAIWYFLENKKAAGRIVNVGTGKDISILEFAKVLSSIIGYTGDITFDAEKPDGTPRKLLDVTLAKTLGWESKIELMVGLKRTYNWFTKAYEDGTLRGK